MQNVIKATGDMKQLLSLAAALQVHGTKKDVVSVFDDGGFRELLLSTLFDLKLHNGRHGDDAYDSDGNNYELKTVNLVDTSGNLRKNPGITTCHHVNAEIIKRYRNLHAWIVGIFFINEPVEIYELHPSHISHYLDAWEAVIGTSGISHINNPKIKFSDLRANGILHYRNDALAKKYIESGMKKGVQVYKDILEF